MHWLLSIRTRHLRNPISGRAIRATDLQNGVGQREGEGKVGTLKLEVVLRKLRAGSGRLLCRPRQRGGPGIDSRRVKLSENKRLRAFVGAIEHGGSRDWGHLNRGLRRLH